MAYTTIHSTSKRQMKHEFDNGITILTDFNFNISHVEFNGKKFTSFSIEDMSIEEYHLILEKYGNY